MPRGHHDHLARPRDNPLIVLSDVGLGSDLNSGHVPVLVQDMEEVVGWDAEDGFF